MKIALIGLPQTGKKTVFSMLTGIDYDHLLQRAAEYHVGTVNVADQRVDRLSAMYQPKKTKHAEIECLLAPAPPHETKPREQWLNKLKEVDAICHVVRAFDDPSVFHVDGSVDPLRDIEAMNLELTISDLALIELRLDRIAQDQKRKFEQDRANEAELLERLKPHLEAGKSLRQYAFGEGEEKRLRHLQFLTLKGQVVAVNCGENDFPNAGLFEKAEHLLTAQLEGERPREPQDATRDTALRRTADRPPKICQLCAKLELEITQLESEDEQAAFLQELGVEEPAIHVLTRLLYQALGYISFFTTGEDEVRAWSIQQGGTAVDAAYAIHSDLARGFIRAEVMAYTDLVAAADTGHKAEVALKDTGKLHVKGKDYIVADGDIVHIRHSS